MRAAVYSRLSRDRTAQESTARQERACRDYAKARGWKVAYSHSDVDLSAYRRGVVRPGFEQLIAHVEAGDIDVILFWKVDRLVRSPADFERLWSVCEPNGVQLAAVVDPVDTTTEIGMMIVRMLVGFARMESANISLRVKAAKESAAQQGRAPSTGRRPFGLTDDWTQIIEHEADAIRDAYAKLLEGWSAYAIARLWNAQGLVSPTGKPWRSSTVVQCLSSPRIAARRIHQGTVVGEGTWPAILTSDEFDRLHVVLTDPRRSTGGGGPARHLLTGLIECRCGTSMSVRPKANGVRRYLCRRDIGGCGSGIHAGRTEAEVVEALFLALEDADWPTTNDPAGTFEQIRADEAQMVQLARDHAEGRIGRSEWLAMRDVIDRRLTDARRTVARWEPVVEPFTRAEWDANDTPWRRGVLARVLDRVVVGPSTGSRFDPDRLAVGWRV